MDPITPTSILLLPGILAFFGLFVYGVAFGNGVRDHVMPKYRWVGIGLLALAFILGAKTLYLMFEPNLGPFYRAQLSGRKIVAAHYAAMLLPLLLLLLTGAMELWFKRYRADMG